MERSNNINSPAASARHHPRGTEDSDHIGVTMLMSETTEERDIYAP